MLIEDLRKFVFIFWCLYWCSFNFLVLVLDYLLIKYVDNAKVCVIYILMCAGVFWFPLGLGLYIIAPTWI